MHHDEWSDAQSETPVTVDGSERDVAYYDAGEGDPVLFQHGIPTWSYLWRDVATALEDEYRVIVPDLLGYGNSAMSDDFDRSIRAQEAMVDALLADLGIESVTLVGHDIGGSALLRLAVHQPARVDGLVLSNAACYDSWPVEFINGLGAPGAVTDLDEDELDETLDFAFAEGLHGDPADHGEFVEGMKAPWRSEEGRASLERCAVGTNTSHTTELDYSTVTAETLLLWGADDILQPIDYAERLADDIAGAAEVVPLEGAYHWVVEDRTEAYTEHLVDFLG